MVEKFELLLNKIKFFLTMKNFKCKQKEVIKRVIKRVGFWWLGGASPAHITMIQCEKKSFMIFFNAGLVNFVQIKQVQTENSSVVVSILHVSYIVAISTICPV